VSIPPPIDVLHRGLERGVGSFVVETADGLALHDCGPASCLPALEAGLRDRGLDLGEIRHLLLSHIHFDHAGAAGEIVHRHPHVQVHVSDVGAPHLIDPTRLEASARRLWGDEFDELWGPITAIPEANVHVVGSRVLGLECFPSPGHARHHVSYLHEDGTLYAGDSLGVRITPGRYIILPTPPPEIDLDAWEITIAESERRRPERLALVHFGVFDDVERHFADLRAVLELWGTRVRDGMDEDTFTRTAQAELRASDAGLVELYENAAAIVNCHAGIARYWQKRREAAAS
jgi:glyoxylase-like metal-dependent hydrolase (beta-lactamase superfamily II)